MAPRLYATTWGDRVPDYREIFYKRLLPDPTARGKTMVVISHDGRYYHLGDWIVKLDYGELVEDTPVIALIRPALAPICVCGTLSTLRLGGIADGAWEREAYSCYNTDVGRCFWRSLSG